MRKKLWPFQNGMFSITEIGKNWKKWNRQYRKNTLWHKSIGTACKLTLGYKLSSRYRILVGPRDFHGRSRPQSSVENTLQTRAKNKSSHNEWWWIDALIFCETSITLIRSWSWLQVQLHYWLWRSWIQGGMQRYRWVFSKNAFMCLNWWTSKGFLNIFWPLWTKLACFQPFANFWFIISLEKDCQNTPGSYVCPCLSGYEIDSAPSIGNLGKRCKHIEYPYNNFKEPARI